MSGKPFSISRSASICWTARLGDGVQFFVTPDARSALNGSLRRFPKFGWFIYGYQTVRPSLLAWRKPRRFIKADSCREWRLHLS